MREFIRSVVEFGHGMAQRIWLMLAGVAFAGLGIAERLIGEPVPVPGWVAWSVAAVALFGAAAWAYHDLRIATDGQSGSVVAQRVLDELLLIDHRSVEYLLYVVEDGMATTVWDTCGYQLATVLLPEDYAVVRTAYFEIDDFNRSRAYIGSALEPSTKLIDKVRAAQDVLRRATDRP